MQSEDYVKEMAGSCMLPTDNAVMGAVEFKVCYCCCAVVRSSVRDRTRLLCAPPGRTLVRLH
ncbi:hypothetical protein EON67_03635 [archaeon]|nr:MAG: hypothetical protein EON67_03635 [archaeon]